MIITFEGPDCSGKTTQSKLLVDYITKAYPKLHVLYKHFPDHNREDIKLILHNDVVNNPYYIAASYMNEFFYTFNNTENVKTVDNNSIEVTYKEAAKRNDVVLILDRYYYSSLVMCPHWPNKFDNLEDNEENAKRREAYLQNIFGVTGLLLQKYELPASDLTIVTIPDVYDFNIRISNKNKDKKGDLFEEAKKSFNFYRDYADSVKGKAPLYKMNGEVMGPIVFDNSCAIRLQDDNISKVGSYLVAECSNIQDNSKDIYESEKMIRKVFDGYIKSRINLVTSEIEENKKFALLSWGLTYNDIDIYERVDTKEATMFKNEKDYESFKKEVEESKNKTIEPPKNPEEEYKLVGKEKEAYEIIGSPIGADIIKSPDKYTLSKQYHISERIMVYVILLKILRSEHTEKTCPLDKITETTKYIYRNLEELQAGAVVSTEGEKTNEDTRESEGSSKSEDTTKEE